MIRLLHACAADVFVFTERTPFLLILLNQNKGNTITKPSGGHCAALPKAA
jgi:hypothetical protein